MQLQKIMYVLESLRTHKKMTQQHFLQSITSDRQYRRYLNLESDMTIETLTKLINRLDMTLESFFSYVETYVSKKEHAFQVLKQKMSDYDYEHALQDITIISSTYDLTEDERETLEFYQGLITFYQQLGDKEKDKRFVLSRIQDLNLLEMLNHTYYSNDTFSFINLFMNKTYNLMSLDIQLLFQQFYLDFINEKKFLLDGERLENIQMFYSYLVSAIYGKSVITQEETEMGGARIKAGIALTKKTHMTYNLMALNYLNSSMCYLHQLHEEAKKPLFFTFMAVLSQDQAKGMIPAFVTAFSQVTNKDTLLKDILEMLERYLYHPYHYYEEVETYDDLSRCAG
jgi:transcriptional regulator with XRE-family HTH domain